MLLISIIILLGIALLYFLSFREHQKDPVLSVLKQNFTIQRAELDKLEFKEMCLYYWVNGENKDFINSIRLTSNDSGIYCDSSVLYPWLGTFFIPWNQIERIGSFRGIFFQKYQMFKLSNTVLNIAIRSSLLKVKCGKSST